MKRQLCLALALAIVLGGCSFMFTRGPSGETNPPRAFPDCTRSMTWPIVDGVFSALFLAAMLGALGEDDTMRAGDINDDDSTKAEKASSAALFAIATGVGAYVGYSRVSRCRGATERFRAAYPQGYNPYPYYPQPYYPPQQYPPQQYPPQQPQPYPPPQPYTPASPQPSPLPPPGPPPSSSPSQPSPSQVPTALGTEGDVCTASSECAAGLTCASNVCVRPK